MKRAVQHDAVQDGAGLTRAPRNRATLARRSRMRAFTLVELMVVVLIISILAMMALPSMAQRLRAYKGRQAAESLAGLFREARLRAMGRGSAVMVQYDGTGTFTLREAIVGTTSGGAATPAGCERMPESSCFPATRWSSAAENQQLSIYNFAASGDFQVASFVAGVPGAFGALSICFSPLGRSYNTASGTLSEMISPVRFSVARTDGVSVNRAVLVSPIGTARVVVTGGAP